MNEINIKSSTIEKGLDLIKDMMSKILGPTFNELGEMWSDNVKIWRLNNQIRNLEKVKKIVEEQQIDIKQVNVKVLLPYLEGVSLEEDETLQDMWARMFVNYIDSEKNLTINVYPTILRQISTNEVVILKYMINSNLATGRWMKKEDQPGFRMEEIANLERLGLMAPLNNFSLYDGGDKQKIEELEPETYYLSEFGRAFLFACS